MFRVAYRAPNPFVLELPIQKPNMVLYGTPRRVGSGLRALDNWQVRESEFRGVGFLLNCLRATGSMETSQLNELWGLGCDAHGLPLGSQVCVGKKRYSWSRLDLRLRA